VLASRATSLLTAMRMDIFAAPAGVGDQVWPGTGRLLQVPMYGMSVRELLEHDATLAPFIDRVIANGPDAVTAPELLRRYLSVLAVNTAGIAAEPSLWSAAGINARTAQAYQALFQRMFVLDLVPAWFSNRIKRLVKAPSLSATGSSPHRSLHSGRNSKSRWRMRHLCCHDLYTGTVAVRRLVGRAPASGWALSAEERNLYQALIRIPPVVPAFTPTPRLAYSTMAAPGTVDRRCPNPRRTTRRRCL
jgi:hypothetical protein